MYNTNFKGTVGCAAWKRRDSDRGSFDQIPVSAEGGSVKSVTCYATNNASILFAGEQKIKLFYTELWLWFVLPISGPQ